MTRTGNIDLRPRQQIRKVPPLTGTVPIETGFGGTRRKERPHPGTAPPVVLEQSQSVFAAGQEKIEKRRCA